MVSYPGWFNATAVKLRQSTPLPGLPETYRTLSGILDKYIGTRMGKTKMTILDIMKRIIHETLSSESMTTHFSQNKYQVCYTKFRSMRRMLPVYDAAIVRALTPRCPEAFTCSISQSKQSRRQ